MKKKVVKTTIGLVLTTAMITSTTVTPISYASGNSESTKAEYIISINDEQGFNDICEKYDDDIIPLSEKYEEILTENNIVLMNLTDTEANALAQKKDVLVEKNQEINASETDDSFEETDKELTTVPEGTLWNLEMINAVEPEKESSNVRVAVLDSGVAPSDALNLTDSISLIPGEENIEPLFMDLAGHGTSVATLIGAKDNGNGVTGVNPYVEMASVKVLNDELKGTIDNVVEGIYWCIDNDIDVINMSFGTTYDSEILHEAINKAYLSGIIIVAAAGNNGKNDSVEYPAAYDEVIAVGSVDTNGNISEFSAGGQEVEVVAPGELIPSVDMFDYVSVVEGTSMSAAQVTGAVSALLSKDKSKSPEYIREVLRKSTKQIEDSEYNKSGYGLIDIGYAFDIYDKCEDSNTELKEINFGENETEIVPCDAEVEARWSKANHEAAADGIQVWENTVDEACLKKGLRCPDIKDYRDIINDNYEYYDEDNNEKATLYTNGFKNAVANTMYYYNVAKNLDAGQGTLSYIIDGDHQNHPMYNITDTEGKNVEGSLCCMQQLDENWTNSAFGLTGTVTNHKKAVFVLGIAIHNGMDMYAHQAFYKNGSTFINIDDSDDRDDTSIAPDRYKAAKALCRHIYSRWKQRNSDGTRKDASAHVFCVDEHVKATSPSSGFYIVELFKRVRFADLVTANGETEWLKERSVTKRGGSWHILTDTELNQDLEATEYEIIKK